MELNKFNTRNQIVDCMKGVLIVLVVLGHTYNRYTTNFIYLFHVGMFYVLSGYCFRQNYTESLYTLKKIMSKRIKSLWIPYVVYNLFFLIMQNIFVEIGLLTDNPDYFLYEPFHSGGFIEIITFQSAVKIFIKSLFFINARSLCGGLWFLGGLFYVTFVYSVIQYFLRKKNIEKFHIVCSLFFMLCAWIIIKNEVIQKFPLLKQICLVFITEILFTIGTYIKEYGIVYDFKPIIYVIGIIFLSIVAYFLMKFGTLSIAYLHIINPLFYIISIFTGGGIVYGLLVLLSKLKMVSYLKIFAFIGRHTVPILALHLLCFKVVSFLQWKIYGAERIVLALYPVWKNSILWASAYTFVGIIIPLIFVAFVIYCKDKIFIVIKKRIPK